jgi:choline dehydrogenase-like flavoprotein
LPYNRDFNDGDQYGVGLMQYTIGNGKRSDTVSTLIKPLLKVIKTLKLN